MRQSVQFELAQGPGNARRALIVAIALLATTTGCQAFGFGKHRHCGEREYCPPPPLPPAPWEGCCDCDRCATIPKGAIPPRNGTYACQWQHMQMDHGEASKFVIFQNEWFKGGQTLGPDGRRHVATIAKNLPAVPYPVVVATSDDEQLDESRRNLIVQALAEKGIEDADARVVVDKPEQEGLYGLEANRAGAMRQFGGGMMGGMGGSVGGMGMGMGGMGMGGMGMGGMGMGFGGGMGMF